MTQFIPALVGETTRISDRNGNELTFGADGVVSNRGRGVQFERDHRGRIIRIVDPRGNSLKYEYDDVGNLIASVDREGNRTTMTYGLDHRLESMIDPLGVTALKVKYDPRTNRLTALEDAIGQQTKFAYDLNSLSKTSVADGGSTESVRMDWEGNEHEELDERGNRIIREYGHGRSSLPTLERTVIGDIDLGDDGDDLVVRRTFNHLGQMVTETDFRGNVTRHIYTADGTYYGTVHPTGVTEYFQYDSKENLVMTGSSAGPRSFMTYDSAGNLLKLESDVSPGNSGDFGGHGSRNNTNPQKRNTILFDYNEFGDQVSTIDNESNRREFSFDANGNQIQARSSWLDPFDSSVTKSFIAQSEFDANDQTTIIQTPAGNTTISLDAHSRVYSSIDERGNRSDYLYDSRGLLIQRRTYPSSAGAEVTPIIERKVYDLQGRLLYTTEPYLANQPLLDIGGTKYFYDSKGNIERTEILKGLVIEIESKGSSHKSILRTEGMVVDSARNELNSANQIVHSWDSFGTPTEFYYDRWQQLVEKRRMVLDEAGNPMWMVTRTEFDSHGRTTLTTDSYLVPWNTPIGKGASPSVLATRFDFDEAGRPSRTTRLQNVIIDIQDRKTVITNSGELVWQSATFYDSHGRVLSQVSADGTVTGYEYDYRGRLTATIGTHKSTESVGLGNVYPGHQARSRQETEYDINGQPWIRRSGIIQIEDSKGNILIIDRKQQKTTQRTYDQNGNILSTIFPDGTSTRSEFNAFGQIAKSIDELSQETTTTYDSNGRITSVSLPAVPLPSNREVMAKPRWEYSYDASGNLVLLRDNIAEVTSSDIRNDHDGNLGDDTRITEWRYDSQGRLSKRILPNGSAESFLYDSRDRNVLHIAFDGIVERTTYDDRPGAGGRFFRREWYNSEGDFASDPNSPMESWSYTYDAFDRLRSIEIRTRSNPSSSLALTQTQHFEFDPEGRVIRETTIAGSVNYAYDSLGRVVRQFTGNKGSNALDSKHPELDVRYAYGHDGLQRVQKLVSFGQPVDRDSNLAGNQAFETVYHYDVFGRPIRTEVVDQVIESYNFDAMDRVSSISHYLPDSDNTDLGNNQLTSSFVYEYRPDGKKTSLSESLYVDHDSNPLTPRQSLSNQYRWKYDSNGRIVSETIDHSIDKFDRLETFSWDLVGNQLLQTIDSPSTPSIDHVIRSLYDENDRLLDQSFDLGGNGTIERRIQFQWNGTNPARKTIFDEGKLDEAEAYTYNYQGKLGTVLRESFAADRSVIARNLVTYLYDPAGIRVSSVEVADRELSTTVIDESNRSTTFYLTSRQNLTGHEQTVSEFRFDDFGRTVRRKETVFGFDEVSQAERTYSPDTGAIVNAQERAFLHDAHGSVRAIVDGQGVVQQSYFYSAFGSLIAIVGAHGETIAYLDARDLGRQRIESFAWTDLLYAGESFDVRTNQQYLRARWYRSETGRLDQLDPFVGNPMDPRSFHKYGYAHGDPIQGADPTGMFFTIAGFMSAFSAQAQARAQSSYGALSTMRTGRALHRVVKTYQKVMKLYDRLEDVRSWAVDIVDLLDFDISDLKSIQQTLDQRFNIANGLPNRRRTIEIDLPEGIRKKMTAMWTKVFSIGGASFLGHINAQEIIAELATGLLTNQMGFTQSPNNWSWSSRQGPDQVVYHKGVNVWGIFEAKGGDNTLGTSRWGEQMSGKWLEHWIMKLQTTIATNVQLLDSLENYEPMLAAIVRLNILNRQSQIKITVQKYTPPRSNGWGTDTKRPITSKQNYSD